MLTYLLTSSWRQKRELLPITGNLLYLLLGPLSLSHLKAERLHLLTLALHLLLLVAQLANEPLLCRPGRTQQNRI